MSDFDRNAEHRVDDLPEYVWGVAHDAIEIEGHLAACDECRVEVDLLRGMARATTPSMTDLEKQRVSRAILARLRTDGGQWSGRLEGSSRRGWLTGVWRLAAGFALLLTSVGVWRVVQDGPNGEWNPDLAVDGWQEELADLNLQPSDVRLAFGMTVLDDSGTGVWGATGFDIGEMGDEPLPWEEPR